MIFKFDFCGNSYSYDATKNKILSLRKTHGVGCDLDGLIVGEVQHGVKIYLELTRLCNLNCNYCYLSLNDQKSEPELCYEEKRSHFITTVGELLSQYNNAHIVFYGGEPLIDILLLKDLVDYFDKEIINNGYNITYSVSTNGTFLGEDVVSYFCDKQISVTVSMDGGGNTLFRSRGVKCLEKLELALETLSRNNNAAAVTATLIPHSINNIEADIKYLIELPVRSINFISCDSYQEGMFLSEHHARRFCDAYGMFVHKLIKNHDHGKLKKLSNIIFIMKSMDAEQPIERACGYGENIFAINQNGKIFPCPCFLNINDYAIYNGKIKYPPKPSELDCSNCIASSTCKGNCLYSSFIAGKAPSEFLTSKCTINKFFTELALNVYMELYVD